MSVAPTSQIGTTVSIVASEPATYDETGYDALTYVEIEGVISLPELGDESAQGSVNVLKEGRTLYWNSVKSFPEFTVPYLYDASDAGQVIVRAGSNGQTLHSLLIEDVDGTQTYLTGYVANVKDTARSVDDYRGQTFTFRPAKAPVTGSTS